MTSLWDVQQERIPLERIVALRQQSSPGGGGGGGHTCFIIPSTISNTKGENSQTPETYVLLYSRQTPWVFAVTWFIQLIESRGGH